MDFKDYSDYLVLVLIMCSAIIMLVFIYQSHQSVVFLRPPEVSPLSEVEQWQVIATRFATLHKGDYASCYNTTGCYNCVNYSTDLRAVAMQLGFKTELAEGCATNTTDNSTSCHMWVRLLVDVEPQNGKFTNFDKIYLQEKK